MSVSYKNGIKIFLVIGTYSILTITKYVANINRTISIKRLIRRTKAIANQFNIINRINSQFCDPPPPTITLLQGFLAYNNLRLDDKTFFKQSD